MSWLFKSQSAAEVEESSITSHGGGVKEDLSELGKTIGRELWSVASFLAPPPTTIHPNPNTTSSSQALDGIRSDFAEISGRFKSGLSLFSSNKAVNEISKLASNLLQFDDEEEVGVDEEVLEFVKDLAMRPECWIDFPLSLDGWDFEMSDAQREHVLNVESLTPSLASLRNRLCPSHMNEEHFWLIYFVLLHQRLNEQDSDLLSTPQIVEARDMLLQGLQNRTSAQSQTPEVQEKNIPIEEERNLTQTPNEEVKRKEELDVDDHWLKEEDVETAGTSFHSQNRLGDEEDVSFSDLEDDDDNETSSKQGESSLATNVAVSSPNGSSGWVQLSENSDNGEARKQVRRTSREKYSEGEESNDWLTINDSDSDSPGTA